MSSFTVQYMCAHAKTIVSLVETGAFPKNLPNYVQPKTILLCQNAFDSFPSQELKVFDQTFVVKLKVPTEIIKAKRTPLDSVNPVWIRKIILHSQKAHNLLNNFFKKNIPRKIQITPDFFNLTRIYLEVPYEEKEVAKSLGAEWDAAQRQWYALSHQEKLLAQWPKARPPLTQLLGEDRNFSGYMIKNFLDVPFKEKDLAKSMGAYWDGVVKKWYAPPGRELLLHKWPLKNKNFLAHFLFVDMIPSSCWFTNVRSCVEPSDWDRLRKFVYQRAEYRCECCSKSNCTLEAHERWHFNDATKVQKLMRIIALCTDCHLATHIGHTTITNRGNEAFDHLMKVTGMSLEQAEDHIDEAYELCAARDEYIWELDLSIITDSGIKLVERPDAFQRAYGLKRSREEQLLENESPLKRSRVDRTLEAPQMSYMDILTRIHQVAEFFKSKLW